MSIFSSNSHIKGYHPRIISPNFGSKWIFSFRGHWNVKVYDDRHREMRIAHKSLWGRWAKTSKINVLLTFLTFYGHTSYHNASKNSTIEQIPHY